jgi:hypothetical protein
MLMMLWLAVEFAFAQNEMVLIVPTLPTPTYELEPLNSGLGLPRHFRVGDLTTPSKTTRHENRGVGNQGEWFWNPC